MIKALCYDGLKLTKGGGIMIDALTAHISFLLFEAIFCLLSALVYAVSKDPVRIRKSVVLSLNLSCGVMLICEYMFYVYRGSTEPFDVFIMHLVNAAVYYLIILLAGMFFMHEKLRRGYVPANKQ